VRRLRGLTALKVSASGVEDARAAETPCLSEAVDYAQTAVTQRYRVWEPETPSDLPLELVQEWDSEIVIEPGMTLEMDDGEVWRVSAVEPDPDQAFAGRAFFVRTDRA
jgi:hypothetical protein